MSHFVQKSVVSTCLVALFLIGGYQQATADNEIGAAPSESTMSITGAGSSFAAPIFNKWFEVYAKEHPDLALSYESVGSGEGIKRFLANTVDIGATDEPLRSDEAAKVGEAYRQVPVTAGMIAIAYNLPGIGEPLKLPRNVYVDIFRGELDHWDDPRIAAANPGVSLPHKLIQLVARQDSSGTTFAFTNHLAAISNQWDVGAGKLIKWPDETMLTRGNEGVAGRIKITEGSIGYVEAGFAQRLNLPLAWLENQSGGFVAPSAESGQSALAGGLDSITDPPGAQSYPIVTYTWALLRSSDGNNAAKGNAINALIHWILTDGQSYANALWYVPLPENVAQAELQNNQ